MTKIDCYKLTSRKYLSLVLMDSWYLFFNSFRDKIACVVCFKCFSKERPKRRSHVKLTWQNLDNLNIKGFIVVLTYLQ